MKKILSTIALAAVAVVSFVWAISAPGLQWLCGGILMLACITKLCETIKEARFQDPNRREAHNTHN